MRLATTKEASMQTGYSERHIRRLCDEERIPGAVKRGRDWDVPQDWIDQVAREKNRQK